MKSGLINRHILMEQLQKKCMDSDTVDFHRGLLEAQRIVMNLPDENDRQQIVDVPKMCEECHSQSYDNGFDAGYQQALEDAKRRIKEIFEEAEDD